MAAKSAPPTAPNHEVDYFKAIPWCNQYFAAPNLTIVPAFSRSLKPGYEDALMCQTLATRFTIPAFVLFYPRPDDPSAYLPEVRAFVSLGNLVSGWSGMSHGGIVATVLDETMSFVIARSRHQDRQPGAVYAVTAYLHTRYLRPVVVPSTYLVTARLVKVEGRKTFVEAFIQSREGERVAEGEALFVKMRPTL